MSSQSRIRDILPAVQSASFASQHQLQVGQGHRHEAGHQLSEDTQDYGRRYVALVARSCLINSRLFVQMNFLKFPVTSSKVFCITWPMFCSAVSFPERIKCLFETKNDK